LNEQQAYKLMQFCSWVELNPNDILIQEDRFEMEMYLLVKGSLKVTLKEQDIVAATIENVGVIGEIEVLLNKPYVATVTAKEPSKLMKISKTKLASLFSKDIEIELKIYRNLCKILCEKIVSGNIRLQDYCKYVDPVNLELLSNHED
jgi:CRP-like cAMP-binding protein